MKFSRSSVPTRKIGHGLANSSRFGLSTIQKNRRTIRITGHDTKQEYSAFGSDGGSQYYDSCRYSWEEVWVQKEGACESTTVPGGFHGYADDTPAVEVNGATEVTEGFITEAWLSDDGSYWLFNGTGGGGSIGGGDGSGQCCIGAPIGIYAFAQQSCCDDINGHATGTWYLFWDQDCVPYIFDDRAEAVNAASSLGLSPLVYGECPEPPS